MILKCKMCGGDLNPIEGNTTVECEFCGTMQTIANVDNEKKANLFNRANRLRMASEFDKAAGVYEGIVSEFPEEAEAYWGLCLCAYGIEYVDDPASGRKMPTCHRTLPESIMDNSNFEIACEYADSVARKLYREEAKAIDRLQRDILSIVANEEPYDVFICYKETDEAGSRTIDSVLAQDIYDALTTKDMKVFFARITLEDKLGQQYEPYIYAALHSAKVMLAIGTSFEYYDAVWVKNEWSRFLDMASKDKTKILIPCYKDIDAYDIPKEFRNLQAQDMGKLGWMQDLVRGVAKLCGKEERRTTTAQTIVTTNSNAFTERGYIFLEDNDYPKAAEYFEKALDASPKDSMAYIGKLMAQICVSSLDKVSKHVLNQEQMKELDRAIRFANDTNKQKLQSIREQIEKNIKYAQILSIISEVQRFKDGKNILACAKEFMSTGNAAACANALKMIEGLYHGRTIKCITKDELNDYKLQVEIMTFLGKFEKGYTYNELYNALAGRYTSYLSESQVKRCLEKLILDKLVIKGHFDDKDQYFANIVLKKIQEDAKRQQYNNAINTFISAQTEEELQKVISVLDRMRGYEEADKYCVLCQDRIAIMQEKASALKEIREKNALAAGRIGGAFSRIVGLKADGTFFITGKGAWSQEDIKSWKNIIAFSSSNNHIVGLKSNGTVVAAGCNEDGRCNVNSWRDIVTVVAGASYTIGLKKDGTVVATGSNAKGGCNVGDWKDIVAITTGGTDISKYHTTVGLKSDGRIVVASSNPNLLRNLKNFNDTIAISASGDAIFRLRSNGTVVASGSNYSGQCNVSHWEDIVAVYAAEDYTLGLKSDGTVVAVGDNKYGQRNVRGWENIVAVFGSSYKSFGLKSDGTLVTAGNYKHDTSQVNGWKLFNNISSLKDEVYSGNQKCQEAMRRTIASTQHTIESLQRQTETNKTQLENLRGLFTGKRRKELEKLIASNEHKIHELQTQITSLEIELQELQK